LGHDGDPGHAGGGLINPYACRTDLNYTDMTFPAGGHITVQIFSFAPEAETTQTGDISEIYTFSAGCVSTNGYNPCMTNLTFSVKNTDVVSHMYFQCDGSDGPFAGGLVLDPGQSGFSKATWPCEDAYLIHLYVHTPTMYENGGGNFIDGTGTGTADGGNDTGAVGSGSPGNINGSGSWSTNTSPINNSPPSASQYNPTNALHSGTNSPILFSGTNQIQQGKSAIYDALSKLGEQAHQDAAAGDQIGLGISNAVAQAAKEANRNATNFLNVTNNSGTETNYALETTQLGIQGTLWGMSNIISGFVVTASNLFGNGTLDVGFMDTNGIPGWVTNAGDSGTNYEFGGPTNYEGALAASEPGSGTPMGTVQDWFGSAISGIVLPDAAPSGTDLEGGNPGGMTLSFGSAGSIDFNPLHSHGYGSMTDIFKYAQLIIKWLLCVYYIKRCLVDSRWAISVCNQTHGTMNPAGIQQRP
jgi:hypothetical protein